MKLNRISLNTIGLNRIGLNRIGSPSRGSSSGSNRPYIDPEVLASLVAVVKCDGKSNNDPDRAIIKNLVDPDNPFVVSNAAYTKGSGYADKDSPYYGALVTDGVNDMITSTKTMSEMLGGGNKCTVISFITHISGAGKYNIIGDGGIQVSDYSGQSFMAGCSSKSGEKIVELGDKEKIQVFQYTTFDSKLSIGSLETGLEISSYAYYGTFVFNKDSVPIDWIHQVIAYFYLDKYVTADIIYDTIRQGITNENHASFNDELVDFSGNGYNLKIYNSAWNKESGINDEGAWQTDGVTDYGQYVGDLELKDYTIAIDRAYVEAKASQVPIISNAINLSDSTPFIMEYLSREMKVSPNSFGVYTTLSELNINRFISYQNTYKYGSTNITRGTSTDTGSGLTIGRKFGSSVNYCNIALWSLLLFPYSLSEFLLERQLKRYKLGTLYPDMVEFRPIIKSNVDIDKYLFINKTTNKQLNIGDYFAITDTIEIQIYLTDRERQEITNFTVNGKEFTPAFTDTSIRYLYNIENFGEATGKKSPQKIDITIDEYIRYEDIVQPYPFIFPIVDANNKVYSWGDKIKVGTEIKFAYGSSLLPQLYELRGEVMFNGNAFDESSRHIIGKTNIFTLTEAPKYLKDNEPNCILAPQILRIPNASYKILGYIPDLTGKGNHGVFNNFAFTEESGVNEDGSIHFDGVEDFITIPTLASGAKQVLMKVNWQEANRISYDQRNGNNNAFAIYTSDEGEFAAYNARNNGETYIDGVLNSAIMASQLKGITHNITITNSNVTNTNSTSPRIGVSTSDTFYTKMALFTFMSFPEISSEEEIKELNDIVGIEGGYVESPDYYWDAYGKSNNLDEDIDLKELGLNNARNMILDKSIEGLEAIEHYKNTGSVVNLSLRRLSLNNFAFNEESGYNGWLGVGNLTNSFNKSYVTSSWKRGGTFIKNKRANVTTIGYTLANWYDATNHILKFKIKITGLADNDTLYICQYNVTPITSQQLFNGINDVTLDLSASPEPTYRYISFSYSLLTNDVDFEFLYEYQNGLVSDGVEDNLKNTSMPILTDYTWIMKRKRLNDKALTILCHKGEATSSGAFLFEYIEGGINTRSFGATTNVTFPDLISYQTKNSYNGQSISVGSNVDGTQLRIFMGGNTYPYYTKAVFYKAMLYSKTIDMLSINMLKNLFAKDELIDVNNPIFKK